MSSCEALPPVDRETLLKMNSCEALPPLWTGRHFSSVSPQYWSPAPGVGRKGTGPLGALTYRAPPPFRPGLQRGAGSLLPWPRTLGWRPQKHSARDSKALTGRGEGRPVPPPGVGKASPTTQRPALQPPVALIWHNLCPQLGACRPPLDFSQASLDDPAHFFLSQFPFSFNVPAAPFPGWARGQVIL